MKTDNQAEPKIMLASGSKYRIQLMESTGLLFTAEAARIDERSVEEPLLKSGLEPADIAEVLAEAKAQDVSQRHPHRYVIGCDQTLSLLGVLYHKPRDMAGARKHLLQFSGKTHQLNSAIALVLNGETIWRYAGIANMHVRRLSPEFVGRYLADIGENALTSVGAYQIEGKGIQLFDKIDGDYFTIIGLPLLPLLEKLREMKIIDG